MEKLTVYTVEETAKILKISINELRKLMNLKQITFFEVGEDSSKRKVKRFRENDINNYIHRNLVKNIKDTRERDDYNE